MAWATVGSVTFLAVDEGRWKFIELPTVAGAVAFALAVEASSSGSLPRRRIGFMAPFAAVDSQQLVGPITTVFTNLDGEGLALHLIEYLYLDSYPGLRARAAAFGVAFTPERGAFPAVVGLAVLT